jgi:hypothetical protein
MSIYQPIRARYELAIRDALAELGVILHYDNVQEEPTPPEGATEEYASIAISFPGSTDPTLCGGVYRIRGNVQVNCYAPRMGGMRRLEEMADAVVCALIHINEYPTPENVKTLTQGVQGPTSVLSGNDPQAAVVVSAPFTASVNEI